MAPGLTSLTIGPPGVCEGDGGLRHQLGRGPVFRVGVGDVQAHAAGAGGAHLQVQPRTGGGHGAVDDEHVAHELRHRLRDEQQLQRLCRSLGRLVGGLAGGPAAVVGAVAAHRRQLRGQRLELVLGDQRGGVDILVADGGGGVDAVHHHVGPVSADELRELRAGIGLIQPAEQVVVQAGPALG
jgi:hypothetical protein